MNDGADLGNGGGSDTDLVHQTLVAGKDMFPVNDGFDAASGVVLGVLDFFFDRLAVGGDHRLRDGVMRKALRRRSGRQQLFLRPDSGNNVGHGEATLGKGTGLIEHNGLCLGKSLHIAGALYKDPAAGSAADSAEEGKRHADNQRAGTGNNQKYQSTLYPDAPLLGEQQGRKNSKQSRTCHDAGGIPVGKAGDKALDLCFLIGGIFHQLQNLSGGGFAVSTLSSDRDDTGEIHRSADNGITRRFILRQAFAGQGGGVHGGGALKDHAVQRNLFAGTDDNGFAYLHLLGVYLFLDALPQDIGIVGTKIHELGDIAAGLADRNTLKPLADLVEQHNGNRFPVIAQYKGADGSNGHEEFLIEQIAVQNLAKSAPQNVPADDEVRHTVCKKLPDALQRKNKPHQRQQHRRSNDAQQMFFLFSCHFDNPLSPFRRG